MVSVASLFILLDSQSIIVDDGEKGDAMDEVEVEVHEVPDSVGEKKELEEEGMVNKEGTSNVEREETSVENREENQQDQMEM